MFQSGLTELSVFFSSGQCTLSFRALCSCASAQILRLVQEVGFILFSEDMKPQDWSGSPILFIHHLHPNMQTFFNKHQMYMDWPETKNFLFMEN